MEIKLNVVNGLIEIAVSQVLTDVQMEKFENKALCSKIEAAAKDFQLNWSIDVNDNIATLVTSTITSSSISTERLSIVKKNAVDFKIAVDKMDVPEHPVVMKEEDLKKEDLAKNMSDYDFVKMLIDDWDETDERLQTAGFIIMASSKDLPAFRIPCGRISGELAKELCVSYLKVHSND